MNYETVGLGIGNKLTTLVSPTSGGRTGDMCRLELNPALPLLR